MGGRKEVSSRGLEWESVDSLVRIGGLEGGRWTRKKVDEGG